MDGKKILIASMLALVFGLTEAKAAVIELSGMLAYGKTDFADGYKSTQRRYTGSIDFKFTPVSALQFEYTDSRTDVSYPVNIGAYLPYMVVEQSNYKDKIYSFNWVQNLVPSAWIIQPYIVFGGGKMKRTFTRSYPELRLSQTLVQDVTNGTGGVGIRIFFTKRMAIKGEVKTYVPDFRFSKWKENQLFSTGLSLVF